jgi:hypothetical protein
MDVVLDTNAVRASGLNGPALSSLREYLSKTKSSLLLPEVVVEELSSQRRMQIEEALQKIANGNNDLKRLVPAFSENLPEIDIVAAVADYRAEIMKSADRVTVLENSPDDLKELIQRLANRIPPASSKGEEARDVLLWLAVVAVGKQREVVLVSGDKKAFFHEGTLKKELQAEVNGIGDRIKTYEGLDEFLKAHHRRSSWVEKKWVDAQVDTELVDKAIEAYLNGCEEQFVPSYTERRDSPTGYASLLQVMRREVKDFFVSDMTSGALLVGVSLWAELEIEAEYELLFSGYWKDRKRRPIEIKTIYPTVLVQLELEVVGKEVKSASVSDIERD